MKQVVSLQNRRNLFAMTVDVDGWSSLLEFYSVPHRPSIIDRRVDIAEGIHKLLELFKKYDVPSTFFFTGDMARFQKSSLKTIQQKGHEIACHGLHHRKNECLHAEAKQRKAIEQATKIIEEESGASPKGFRAPCLRFNEATLRVLRDLGYVYDSSVVPTSVPGYYGKLSSPLRPHYPSSSLLTREGSSKLLEIPVSVNPVVRVPLSAAWMRNLGSLWVKIGIKLNFDMGNLAVFYVHPRDVMSLPRTDGVPWHLYRNTGERSLTMLESIIRFVRKRGAFVRLIDFANHHMANADVPKV